MVKVITYGTYDLLHYGHIKLLERAKALGDYLIVGVTADDFDKTRGKINVQQSLMERIDDEGHDQFTKITFLYDHAVASATVAKGVKSEGELIISGTRGYIYVPAPWWKTDYFEIRYEDASQNKRYFYQLDGEGIRYELVAFTRAIGSGRNLACVDSKVSNKICEVIGNFYSKVDCAVI